MEKVRHGTQWKLSTLYPKWEDLHAYPVDRRILGHVSVGGLGVEFPKLAQLNIRHQFSDSKF